MKEDFKELNDYLFAKKNLDVAVRDIFDLVAMKAVKLFPIIEKKFGVNLLLYRSNEERDKYDVTLCRSDISQVGMLKVDPDFKTLTVDRSSFWTDMAEKLYYDQISSSMERIVYGEIGRRITQISMNSICRPAKDDAIWLTYLGMGDRKVKLFNLYDSVEEDILSLDLRYPQPGKP